MLGPIKVRAYCELFREAIEVGDGSILFELGSELTNDEKEQLVGELRSYERRLMNELSDAYKNNKDFEFHGWIV